MLKIDKKYTVIFVAVIGLLVFLHLTKILLPAENLLRTIINPLLGKFYSISTDLRTGYSEQTDKRNLTNEVKRLEIRARELTVENARLKSLEEENQILREHLRFSNSHDYDFVLANVISRGEIADLPSRNQILIIDKGTKHGLSLGLPVLSSQGIIIGKIAEVKDNVSKVNLTTDSQCKLAATIQNRDKTLGVAEGELGLTIIMNFIPQTEGVEIGDIIVTSGLEEKVPRGLVIGTVSQVLRESNEVWQSTAIEPLASLDGLVIVSVLLP